MRIAVTYDQGQIFQHFGQTRTFKIYDVVDDKIMTSGLLPAGEYSHGALADFLAINGVNVLICGGMGLHPYELLKNHHIEVINGATGDVDSAVNAYLSGDLQAAGTSAMHQCHHH